MQAVGQTRVDEGAGLWQVPGLAHGDALVLEHGREQSARFLVLVHQQDVECGPRALEGGGDVAATGGGWASTVVATPSSNSAVSLSRMSRQRATSAVEGWPWALSSSSQRRSASRGTDRRSLVGGASAGELVKVPLEVGKRRRVPRWRRSRVSSMSERRPAPPLRNSA